MSSESGSSEAGCVITIGNFDGVHQGHRALIQRVVKMANRLHLPSMVFTFDPPPLKLLRPQLVPKPLTLNGRRETLLRSLGVDRVVFYPTTQSLLDYSPSDFFLKILVQDLKVRGIVEGPNFLFGKNRSGSVQTLGTLCAEHGVAFEVAQPKYIGERLVSSTQIREWIDQGELKTANSYLVEPYRIEGRVVHGAARGRTLGFPTANLEGVEVLVPKHGVYAARVVSPGELDGLPVALHIGPNPTFGEDASKIEAHLVGFQGDIYGKRLEIEILELVRGVKKFQSKEDLLSQLALDVQQARQIVLGHAALPE